MLGSTVERSSSRVSVYVASSVAAVWKSPCSLQYASTRLTCSAERPDKRRYRKVSASTGKMPHVAPYSGAMFAMVARSASEQRRQTWPVELHEFADHALLAQHLRDGEHEIGRGRAFAKLPGELEADHLRNEHGDGLTEHGRLCLDAAHAPAEHAQAVDHRGMRVGADEGIGVSERTRRALFRRREDDARQVLEIDLVDDAGVGRHHFEILERVLPPAQECVALAVAPELQVGVDLNGLRIAELVDLHGVVDDELDRLERIDARRLAAHFCHGIAHGRQIDDRGHAGEILEQHAARRERDLGVRLRARIPLGERANLLGPHRAPVFRAKQVLERYAERVRELAGGKARLVERVEPEDVVLAAGGAEDGAATKAVVHGGTIDQNARGGGNAPRVRERDAAIAQASERWAKQARRADRPGGSMLAPAMNAENPAASLGARVRMRRSHTPSADGNVFAHRTVFGGAFGRYGGRAEIAADKDKGPANTGSPASADAPAAAATAAPTVTFPDHASVDAAIKAVPQGLARVNMAQDALEAPLMDHKRYEACKVPNSVHFTIRAAVYDGAAVGVDVTMKPKNTKLEACVDQLVRSMSWPKVPSLNTVTANY